MYTPIEAYDKIREVLLRRPDLRFKEWKTVEDKHSLDDYFMNNSYMGFCYVATYAFCYLIKEARPYTIDRSHFWAQIDDEIWDLTKEQFDYEYPYHKGKKLRRKFKPTERVQEVLKELSY